MANIRTACPNCAAAVLLSPTQVLLLQSENHVSDAYLFFCLSCCRITVISAAPAEILLLLAAGVPPDTGGRPVNPGEAASNPHAASPHRKGKQL